MNITAVRFKIAKRCISYAGTVIGNGIVSVLDVNCSLCTFKRELKRVRLLLNDIIFIIPHVVMFSTFDTIDHDIVLRACIA